MVGDETYAVKVLYSLDSSPHHTMMARSPRRMLVRLAPQHATGSQAVQLGRVPLKACLGAICAASPEFLLDKTNDYIVYAVDPQEALRAMHRSPSHRADESSPSKRAQVLVGKGFFSGVLEEPGEGTLSVTGRMRAESRQNFSAFSSDEEEAEAADVLEVVLRMKEAPQRSREQYHTLMKGMHEQQEKARAVPSTSPTAEQRQLMSMLNVIAGALPEQRTTPSAVASSTPAPNRRTDRVCYNCGTTDAKTWRMLQLHAGAPVRFPASERPPPDAVPLTWTPKHKHEPSCTADGETRWEACNRCGLYYTKNGVSRPDSTPQARAEKKKSEVRGGKRIKVEETAAAKHMGRTLSAVANRDAARLQQKYALHEVDPNVPPRRTALSSPGRAPPSSPGRARMPPPVCQSSPQRRSTPGPYGAPSYLMHSSPNTALNTLLSEAELDFDEMQPHGLYRNPASPSPVRRSPRKRPHGTHGYVNPYATQVTHSDPGTLPPLPRPDTRMPSSPQRAATPETRISPGILTRSRSKRDNEMGPFMGLEDDVLECPPSPSVGQSHARAQRAERKAQNTKHEWAPPSPGLGLSHPPRPQALPLEGAGSDVFSESRSGTWLDPSVLGAWDAAQAKEQPVVRRRPLPATVEDASSSHPSSPAESEGDPLVELFEDPYGLLAASGLGAYAAPTDASDGAVAFGNGLHGISMDTFNQIEVHNAPAFAEQLRQFTEQGGLGVAAHLGTAHTPHVESFGERASLPAPDGELEAFLDDPSVRAMLANLEATPSAPAEFARVST